MKRLGTLKKRKSALTPVPPKKKLSVRGAYTLTSGNAWDDDKEYPSMSKMLEQMVFSNEDTVEFEVKYSNEDRTRTVGFLIKPESEYCCGVGEIGELSGDTANVTPMNLMFSKFLEDFKGKAFILTTIPTQKSWEEYLGKSKLFKAVKTFKNSNTQNMVTLWITAN